MMLDLHANRRTAHVAFALLGLLLAAAPFLVGASLGNGWVRIIDFALLYVMLALGLNIVVGYAGLLDLGYVAFYAVGAYLYALLASPQFGLHLPVWLILPLGGLLAALFGMALGTPTLRLRGDYLAIVTLGFGEIIRIFLNNLNAPVNITNGPQGLNMIDPIAFGGFSLNQQQVLFGVKIPGIYAYYYLFLALALLIVFISLRLQDSRIGRAWVAIREDEVAAEAMGINTRNVKLLAFAMGASFGGISGGLFAGFQGFVSPESFNLMESVMILCMVVLGGMGHIPGVILGALLLTILPEALRYIGPLEQYLFGRVVVDPADLRLLLFGLALVVVMISRPAGLWPSSTRQREFTSEPEVLDHEREDLYDVRTHGGEPHSEESLAQRAGHMVERVSELFHHHHHPAGAGDATRGTELLQGVQLSKNFGGLAALSEVTFSIRRGEIYGLIGPNGAGKTTLFNTLTGLYGLDTGKVLLDGQALNGLKPSQVTALGLARTFQNIRLFANMTALENVMAARHVRTHAGVPGAILRDSRTLAEERDIRRRALALLDYVGIVRHAGTLAKQLSYGDQRRLEIARALATEPKLLALDEPAAGMNPRETETLKQMLQTLRADGVTLLLIEHHMKLVMGLCDRVAVLDYGRKIAEGTPAEVQRDPRVIEAYLGASA